jgi:hypothetical protein
MDTIYVIDETFGNATVVGSTGLGGATPDLFFDDTGTLFGSKGGGNELNTLITIDVFTGAGTAIGPIGFVSVSGLDCAPVPEPSVGLMLLFGVPGLARLARMRRTGG